MIDKKETRRFYEITSNSYDELYGDEQKEKYQCIFEIVKEVKGNVLDLGCGSGMFEQNIKTEDGCLLFAVDFSLKLLDKAKEKLAGRNNVFLICGDAEWLPFQEKIFDFSFSFTVFQNLPNPSATAKELRRVLKKDGIVVLTYLKKSMSSKISDLFENYEIFNFQKLNEYIIKVKI